jgi:tRNA-Thr(GGU) m(6)t(6)A37 methyltransferase TsaA
MTSQVALTPIGIVRSPVTEPLDDVWGGVISSIELDRSRFQPDALAGLDEFSHVEIVFLLDRVEDSGAGSTIEFGARHPRGRTDWPKTGILAQRAKNRPNRIGVTVCRLVETRHLSIVVEGLDAIDGTPVLDIKPWLKEFGPREPVRQPAWATELMSGYWTTGRS